MTEARLTNAEGGEPVVRLERQLADPPSVVWRALTEREQLSRWFPCEIAVEGEAWVVGAALLFRFPAEVIDLTLRGEVLAVEAPRLLSFSWGEDILRFELFREGSGTRLVLSDQLPPATAARNAAGWQTCLHRLAGLEPDADAWRDAFSRYAELFAPALGPQQGPPAGHLLDTARAGNRAERGSRQ